MILNVTAYFLLYKICSINADVYFNLSRLVLESCFHLNITCLILLYDLSRILNDGVSI